MLKGGVYCHFFVNRRDVYLIRGRRVIEARRVLEEMRYTKFANLAGL